MQPERLFWAKYARLTLIPAVFMPQGRVDSPLTKTRLGGFACVLSMQTCHMANAHGVPPEDSEGYKSHG